MLLSMAKANQALFLNQFTLFSKSRLCSNSFPCFLSNNTSPTLLSKPLLYSDSLPRNSLPSSFPNNLSSSNINSNSPILSRSQLILFSKLLCSDSLLSNMLPSNMLPSNRTPNISSLSSNNQLILLSKPLPCSDSLPSISN